VYIGGVLGVPTVDAWGIEGIYGEGGGEIRIVPTQTWLFAFYPTCPSFRNFVVIYDSATGYQAYCIAYILENSTSVCHYRCCGHCLLSKFVYEGRKVAIDKR